MILSGGEPAGGVTIRRVLWLILVYGLPALLVLVPLLTFLSYSFYQRTNTEIIPDLTLANYADWFDPEKPNMSVFGFTFVLALEVMLIDLVLGFAVAYFIYSLRGRVRFLLLLLTMIPLFMSYIIKLYAMRTILDYHGFLNQLLIWIGILEEPSRAFLYNRTAILLTMTVVYLPFVVVPIYVSLEKIGRNLVLASADLGGRPIHGFLHIILPLGIPGAAVAGLFAFVLAMGDFLTPQMVGGTGGFTYGRLIETQFGMAFNWPGGSAMGVILLAASLAVITICRCHRATRERVTMIGGTMTGGERLTRVILGLVLACVFIILYAPVMVVAVSSLFDVRRGRVQWDSFDAGSYLSVFDNDTVVEALANTLAVGFVSVLAAIILAAILAIYVNGSTSRWRHALQFMIFLPFLLPPIVTGLALLTFTRE